MTTQKLISELRRQASQENCDGDPWDLMQLSAEKMVEMREMLAKAAVVMGNCYDATAWPADGTSDPEITAQEMRNYLLT